MEILLNATGHQLFEYMLVIDIPKELRQRIETCRLQLTQTYGVLQPQTGRPNVSLVRFTGTKMMEEKMINRLQMIALSEKPFMVELLDYGSYPMHALFIQINNQQRIIQLIKNLKQARQLMKAGGDPHFLLDPQIVLAGRLTKDKYMEIMKEYRYKNFAGNFLAESFLLLKKPEREKQYVVVKRFEFDCLHSARTQGVLF